MGLESVLTNMSSLPSLQSLVFQVRETLAHPRRRTNLQQGTICLEITAETVIDIIQTFPVLMQLNLIVSCSNLLARKRLTGACFSEIIFPKRNVQRKNWKIYCIAFPLSILRYLKIIFFTYEPENTTFLCFLKWYLGTH